MYAELQAGLASLKTALALAQAGKDAIDQAAMANALYDLQSRLMETQNAALKAMEENAQLAQRVRELEMEARAIDDWKAEAARYELVTVADGIVALMEIGNTARLRDAVKLCANCFSERKMSILQLQPGEQRQHALCCARCKSRLIFRVFADWQLDIQQPKSKTEG